MALIAVVTASAQVRETLSVILEHEFRLRFLAPSETAKLEKLPADAVLVCEPEISPTLASLRALHSSSPIVAVGTPEAAPQLEHRHDDVLAVALRPLELRGAVDRCVFTKASTALVPAISLVVGALGEALAYPSRVWRMLAQVVSSQSFPTVAAAILIEQASVIAEIVDQLTSFTEKPRGVVEDRDFLLALANSLKWRASFADQMVVASTLPAIGPTSLVPLLSKLVCSCLFHGGTDASIDVTDRNLSLTFRDAPIRPLGRFSLLLAGLALFETSWELRHERSDSAELILLRPSIIFGRGAL